jgi:hypothetical protein
VGEVPLVEPGERRATGSGSAALVRGVWFFGISVTVLIGLQTLELFLGRAEPPGGPTPVVSTRGADAPAPRTTLEQIDRMLLESRVQLSRGLYEQVVRVLEPLAQDPRTLDSNQRFEAYLLLAKAQRALGNVEKAQEWGLRATDQAVDRRAPEQVFEQASSLGEEGRQSDARRVLHQLLARADALSAKDQDYRIQAQVRVADAWWDEAQRSGAFAPLPGLEHASQPAPAPARAPKGKQR